MIPEITTQRLKIIACNTSLLEAAITGNEELENHLKVHVPANWTEFGTEPLQYVLEKLRSSESENGWWTWFPILKNENMLIGSGGYKGAPNADGMVEIGYEISAPYREKGLATEMAMALIENAFSNPDIKTILAHSLGCTNPSTAVLSKCGFKKIAELHDDEAGLIWKWELTQSLWKK